MTFQFNGIIKKVFDYREGVSQRTGQKWESLKIWLEETGDGQYKSGVIVEAWRPSLIEWLRANVGALVTIDFEPRVEVYNEKIYQRCRALGCTSNGIKVGIEPTPAGQPQPQPQVIYANNVPPQAPQNGQSEDDLPF